MIFIVKVVGMTTCDLIKVWLTCALSDVDEKELQPDTDEYSFISSEESRTFSKVCCSHMMLATDFIQALNESKDFDLWILCSNIFAIFYRFWDIRVPLQHAAESRDR